MEEYSKRLGRISPEQFQAALARFGLGDFVRAERVPSGLFGQNVFVTSSRGEFVLRGVPHYDWQFPTERFFAEQIHGHTNVPVPYPYLVEQATDIFGWSFVLMPRLPGISTFDPVVADTLSPEDRLGIARALAHTLVEIQSVTWSQAGTYDLETKTIRPFGQRYDERTVQQIRQKIAEARSYNPHTTASDLTWVEAILTAAAGLPAEPEIACIVLGDYGEHNIVAEHTPDGWRVSGVFDLMTAHFGDGNADLCQPVAGYLKKDSALADEFVREYLRLRPVRPDFVKRQQLYSLGLYANMWEYWQREKGGPPEGPEVCFEQWTRPIVDYWARFM